MNRPVPPGLEGTLRALTAVAEKAQHEPRIEALALDVAGPLGRDGVMTAFVNECRRRFVYVSDPTQEAYPGAVPIEPGTAIDVDDACLFVAALAASLGIRTRFVAVRYHRWWTCLVEYEDENGSWKLINALGQKTDRKLEERVEGPVVEPNPPKPTEAP